MLDPPLINSFFDKVKLRQVNFNDYLYFRVVCLSGSEQWRGVWWSSHCCTSSKVCFLLSLRFKSLIAWFCCSCQINFNTHQEEIFHKRCKHIPCICTSFLSIDVFDHSVVVLINFSLQYF